MKKLMLTLIVSLFVVGSSLTGYSQESDYVTVKQDGTGDYSTIQAAIDDPMRSSTEIIVFPGIYKENIVISQDVLLRSYDGPYLTSIDGSARVNNRSTVIKVSPQIKDVKIVGFYITGSDTGIYVDTASHVLIANCVIHKNNGNGIWTYWNNVQDQTVVYIQNNVIIGNGINGIYLDDHNDSSDEYYMYLYPVHIKNNVIIQNQNNGIAQDCSYSKDSIFNTSSLIIDHNNFMGNVQGNYGLFIGDDQPIKPGNSEISTSPYFVGTNTGVGLDVRLMSTSPCRDAGEDGVIFNDPDGTQNDMGAYGGPWAATFYEAPNDGPVVRRVSITPGSVPQGETFVIKAVGSVR